MRPRGVGVPGHQRDLSEQGGAEGLAAAGPGNVCVPAEVVRELRQTCERIAGVQHVLGDAEVGVEHAPGEFGHVPDLGELPPGVTFPCAGGVGDEGLQVRERGALANRPGAERGGPFRLPARLAEVPGVPGRDAAGDCEPSPLGGCRRGQVAQDRRRRGRLPRGGERVRAPDSEIGAKLGWREVGGGGVRARGPPVAGGVAQIRDQNEQVAPVARGGMGERLLGPALAVGVGAEGGRPPRRRGQQRDGIAGTTGAEEVVGDLFRRATALVHTRGGAKMHLDELRRIEPPAGHVPQERVTEAETSLLAREDAAAESVGHRGVGAGGVDTGDRGDVGDRERVLQGPGDPYHGPRILGRPVEPGLEERGDVLRYAHAAALVDRGGELLGEEGVARRAGGDGGDRLGSQRPSGDPSGDPREGVSREWAQDDLDTGALFLQAGAHAGELGARLAMACREHDEQGRLARRAGEVVGEQEGRWIGRVEVLERHDRTPLRAAPWMSWATAAKTWWRLTSAPRPALPPAGWRGRSSARTRCTGSASDSVRSGRAARSGASASTTGPYGLRPSSSRPAPRHVCQPRAAASSRRASTRRVLPIPASPRISSAPPRPRSAVSRASRPASSSRSLPTMGPLARAGAWTASPPAISR